MRQLIPAFVAMGIGLAGIAGAQSASVEVKFPAGSSGTVLSDQTVTGAGIADYTLGAGAGQTMYVSLVANPTVYFNILPPGSTGEAIYNGSLNGTNAQITLPVSGSYVIRVYQMGDGRDSGQTSSFNLSITIL